MKRFFAALIAVAFLASPGLAMAGGSRHHNNNTTIRTQNTNNIRNSNTNNIRNSNRNLNLNLNKNSNRNSNRNQNTNVNTNVNTNRQYQGQSQGQYQGQAQGQFIQDKNQQTTVIEGDNFKAYASAPDALAPSLTSGNDVCMGSISVGGSGSTGIIGFGLAIGKTYTDDNCVRLKNANALLQMGHKDAALALLALNEDVAAALNAAGVTFASVKVTEEVVVEVATTSFHSNENPMSHVNYGIDFEQEGFLD